MKYVVTLGGRERTVQVEDLVDGRRRVVLDGVEEIADLRSAGDASLWSLLLGVKSCEISVAAREGGFRLTLRGATLDVAVESEQERNARALTKHDGPPKASVVKASMPGIVTKLLVKPGDAVVKGQPLLIVEAMKMENEVRAEAAGVVADIAVQPGRTVNGGDLLVRLKAP
jgi:biotin carboxyl carrier protein